MIYPLLLMYSDGQFNVRKQIVKSEVVKALAEYPGMYFDKNDERWMWINNTKTIMLGVVMDEAAEEQHELLDDISLTYFLKHESWKFSANTWQMYEKELDLAFYLQEKLGLDVIDMSSEEYLFPNKEGTVLRELRARVKRAPKRKHRFT